MEELRGVAAAAHRSAGVRALRHVRQPLDARHEVAPGRAVLVALLHARLVVAFVARRPAARTEPRNARRACVRRYVL